MTCLLKSFCYLPLLLLCSATLLAADKTSETAPEWHSIISETAAEELKSTGTPSLQIAVAQNGKVIFENAYGMADLENLVAATTQTKYRVASVSKWFTASAAIILSERGKLKLDQPIQNYCPAFPKKELAITPRHLLTHTSGVRHYVDYDEALERAKNDKEREAVIRRRSQSALSSFTRYQDVIKPLNTFKNDPLLFMPGSDWKYTSHGYRLLGCVLAGVMKRPYHEIVQDLVFGPSGMKNTVSNDAWAIIANRASGYHLSRDGSLRRADMDDVSENLPAGGHLSTATDLVRFAQAFNGGVLFPANTASMMAKVYKKTKQQKVRPPSWRDAIPSQDRYGYGVMSFPGYDESNNAWIGHTGRQAGGSAIVILIPKHNLSIAVVTNAKGWNGYMSFIKKIESIVSKAIINKP